ncbi:hypothetical protein HPB51_011556 [Rhipicephalus microplus]|uniref:Peptidase M13 N-terminal domain-containing protein n=1 Tax=Rhipicephalus microplus TaxID=6941 RepID=A0A9J6DGG4_RHIMP|nr:hypothetical protein HPB51_011556 [Rhipicephalus microplus]
MIMRDAVVEGSGNFDHLGFFNVRPNLSTRAYNNSASIGNAAAAAGVRSRDLRESQSQQVRGPVAKKRCGKLVAGATTTSCGLASGFLIALLALYLGCNHSVYPTRSPCDSETCQAVSDLYNKSLSREYKPCDNFYDYVCTGWKMNPSSLSTSVLHEHAHRISQSVIGILRNTSVPTDGQTAVQKLAGLFQSCVNVFSNEEHGPSSQNPRVDIVNFLREHNASFENKFDVDPAHLMLYFSIVYGLPTLFNVRVDTIPGNAERLLVIVSIRRLFLLGERTSDEEIEQHLQWLGLDDNIVWKLTHNIATIEEYLILLCRRAYEDEETHETERSVILLRTMEKAILGRKSEKWNYYMGNITNGLLPGDHYVVFETRYLIVFLVKVFQRFLNPNDLRIWMAFDLSWRLRQLVHVGRTSSYKMSGWETHCLKHASKLMTKAAYATFYHTSLTSDTIYKAKDMVYSIAESLKTRIAESSWIEDSTREIALKKTRQDEESSRLPGGWGRRQLT